MRTCVMVLDVRTTEVAYRSGDGDRGGVKMRWREMNKTEARYAATFAGARFGQVLDYRPVNVRGRRFALALVERGQ